MIHIEKKISLDERNEIIEYVHDHIDELSFNSKRDILTLILNNVADVKIKQKGTGTQVQYEDISNDILIWIYNKIYSALNDTE